MFTISEITLMIEALETLEMEYGLRPGMKELHARLREIREPMRDAAWAEREANKAR